MNNNQSSEYLEILRHYAQCIKSTDRIATPDLHPILFGLFGEVGSIMAAIKKQRRESSAFIEYDRALLEEYGDVLWYLVTLCNRLSIDITEIFSKDTGKNNPTRQGSPSNSPSNVNELLLELGRSASALFDVNNSNGQVRNLLCKFFHDYLQALQTSEIDFDKVVQHNTTKISSRFLDYKLSDLPTFDEDFPADERIPNQFEINIIQRKSGKSYLQMNGVFIGDPLTDNSFDLDGYRFHDVFHLANAAILHWSPVFRGLIKQKRKSKPEIDEIEDGGRASVIEEGLTAWIFSRAKKLDFFAEQKAISFDILKTVQQFVLGYEVEKCPLKLWEDSILEGYKVFRKVRDNKGGIVIGDRETRTIKYKPNR